MAQVVFCACCMTIFRARVLAMFFGVSLLLSVLIFWSVYIEGDFCKLMYISLNLVDEYFNLPCFIDGY